MGKSADAFRTISEVADWLEVPAHVLRFWESKFTQVKPVKRAGGRRYYRPADMRLLGGIKVLLHDEGMTIKGVQKMLREQGIGHVAALAPGFDEGEEIAPAPPAVAQVLSFARPDKAPGDDSADDPPAPASADPQPPAAPEPDPAQTPEAGDASGPDPAEPSARPDPETAPDADTIRAPEPEPEAKAVPEPEPEPEAASEPTPAPAPDTAPQAPTLAPLPDLPADPPDDMAANAGPLSRLAARRRPLPPALAASLAALAARLRETGASRA
jgi:DNA-binding transcriptional MerR regulator